MVRNRELKNDLMELNHRLELIYTALVVSNPDSPMAVDAYEGLRRTVVNSFKASQALQALLAQLDSLASTTDDVDPIRAKLAELMSQYGIVKLTRYEDRPDAFDRIGEGPPYVATKPAYVTSPELPPVQMGVVETANDEPRASSSAQESEDAVVLTNVPKTGDAEPTAETATVGDTE